MEKTDRRYSTYIDILKKELMPAMGCTEPIALAYCAAKSRATLGEMPDRVEIIASGNIIKNVKSVIVPHTAGMKGIETAAAIGILAGNADGELQVLSGVTDEETKKLPDFMKSVKFSVTPSTSDYVLDLTVKTFKGTDSASVRILHKHTNIVHIEKNGEVLFTKEFEAKIEEEMLDYSLLTVRDIYDFALTADLDDVKPILSRQIEYNTAISQEGLKNNWGANIGSTLLKTYGDAVWNRAKAAAAAGSDARMNGCELPVVINSGSGNQGMTVSLPVIEYAKELGSSEEQLYRALLISNLTAIHQKTGIGYLSAYCGAVSAGAAAGAAIAYLKGADYDTIAQTIVNALAITSGIICDGAKSSCAAKIATSVSAGIFAYDMCKNGQKFSPGDGILSTDIEKTIRNVGILGKDGMRGTDLEILRIMTCYD